MSAQACRSLVQPLPYMDEIQKGSNVICCLVKAGLELRYADSSQSSALSFLSHFFPTTQESGGRILGESHKVIVQDHCTDSGSCGIIPDSVSPLLTPQCCTPYPLLLHFMLPFQMPLISPHHSQAPTRLP